MQDVCSCYRSSVIFKPHSSLRSGPCTPGNYCTHTHTQLCVNKRTQLCVNKRTHAPHFNSVTHNYYEEDRMKRFLSELSLIHKPAYFSDHVNTNTRCMNVSCSRLCVCVMLVRIFYVSGVLTHLQHLMQKLMQPEAMFILYLLCTAH